MSDDWPLPAFHFNLILGLNLFETAFQEVSGIEAKLDTEEYIEGGNPSVYSLPKPATNNRLTVKRGVTSIMSPLAIWCKASLESFQSKIVTQSITVNLLDSSHWPVRTWIFSNAYPVSWKIDSFNSTKNEVSIEEIVFCFSRLTRGL